jgi:hypothetical protein
MHVYLVSLLISRKPVQEKTFNLTYLYKLLGIEIVLFVNNPMSYFMNVFKIFPKQM